MMVLEQFPSREDAKTRKGHAAPQATHSNPCVENFHEAAPQAQQLRVFASSRDAFFCPNSQKGIGQ
jgi:hypothetical protein